MTGTNGKTTTTSMLAEIVERSGRSGAACGNIGLPVLDAMRATPRVDVLCAELSSFQLHWAPSVRPAAGVVLNIADDHLDWHGGFEAYAEAKTGALRGDIGVVGLDDAVASTLSTAGRRVGFTLAPPEDGQLGVEDGRLVDRGSAPASWSRPTPSGRRAPRGWPTPWPRRPSPWRSGCPATPSGRPCATSVPVPTAARWSPSATESSSSTTPRPPTRMPRRPRCPRSAGWC